MLTVAEVVCGMPQLRTNSNAAMVQTLAGVALDEITFFLRSNEAAVV
jgi:hypothetical protein